MEDSYQARYVRGKNDLEIIFIFVSHLETGNENRCSENKLWPNWIK